MTCRLQRISIILLSSFFVALVAGQRGNPALNCNGTSLDWYTGVVGETPCLTYQSLRQICNPQYTVPVFSSSSPGDHCDGQTSICCCNSISWSLSMLCLNCQRGNVSGPNGLDAGKGAYRTYLTPPGGNQCKPVTNRTLPAAVQSAVCSTKLKIFDDLYGLFWDEGDWYYVYTRVTLTKTALATDNNTFTHCASETINQTISSLPSQPRPTSAASSKQTSTSQPSQIGLSAGAVGGIAATAATIVTLLFSFLCYRFLYRHRRTPRNKVVLDDSVVTHLHLPKQQEAYATTNSTPVSLPQPSTQFASNDSRYAQIVNASLTHTRNALSTPQLSSSLGPGEGCEYQNNPTVYDDYSTQPPAYEERFSSSSFQPSPPLPLNGKR